MKKAISFFLVFCFLLSAAVFPSAVAEEADLTTPEVYGTQLHIGRDLTVKIYLRVPEGTQGAGVYLSIGKDNARRISGELQEDGTYLVTFDELDTAEMTTALTLEPWALIDHTLVRGEKCGFSIRDYATRLLRRGGCDDTTNALLLALLNYGAAVQEYLDYQVYNKANDYLTEQELILPPITFDEETVGGYYEDQDAPDRYQTVADCTAISMIDTGHIRFYFAVDFAGQENLRINGGAGIAGFEHLSPAAEAEALCRGYVVQIGRVGEGGLPDFTEPIDCTLKKTEGAPGYYATSPAISYLSMREEYVVRVLAPDGKESVAYYYSAAIFARGVLENPDVSLSSKEHRLIHAMLVFGDALTAYEKALAE